MAATTYELIVKTVDQTSGPMSRITGGLGKGKIAFAAVAVADPRILDVIVLPTVFAGVPNVANPFLQLALKLC